MNLFGILAQPLAWIMTWLYGLIGNYGITVIVLTLIVKAFLYPFYKKQILSTSGMTDLQPKMQAIQRKYANDKETMNAKVAELYKEEGVNPMAGCLPMVVQMVIIMGLFTLLRYPLNYVASEHMYIAIHESFLWINDLAQPDPWILPILSGVATFISFYMSSMNGSMPGQTGNTGNAMMNVMKYGFPIMIIWLAKTYAAGLATYWFISQFIQIFYNLRFNQLRKKMAEEKKEKRKKKVKTVGGN
jgi:YidC/Oxa1 family membrane protein insertase